MPNSINPTTGVLSVKRSGNYYILVKITDDIGDIDTQLVTVNISTAPVDDPWVSTATIDYVTNFCDSNDILYANVYFISHSGIAPNIYKSNGLNGDPDTEWTNITAPSYECSGLATINNTLYTISEETANIYAYNGSSWSTSTPIADASLKRIFSFDSKLWVYNKTTSSLWYSSNGTDWTDTSAGPVIDNTSYICKTNEAIAVGTPDTTYYLLPGSTTWTELGGDIIGNQLRSMCVLDSTFYLLTAGALYTAPTTDITSNTLKYYTADRSDLGNTQGRFIVSYDDYLLIGMYNSTNSCVFKSIDAATSWTAEDEENFGTSTEFLIPGELVGDSISSTSNNRVYFCNNGAPSYGRVYRGS